MTSNILPNTYRFGHVIIKESAVFIKTKLSYAFVNIKPVVPGHVLVAPMRTMERFEDMSNEEVNDLFCTAKKISSVVKKHFNATSMTLAIQDGPDAGQTVKHVHMHILPRKKGDFEQNDDIYTKLELHDKDFGENMKIQYADVIPKLRSDEEMAKEADLLRAYFEQ